MIAGNNKCFSFQPMKNLSLSKLFTVILLLFSANIFLFARNGFVIVRSKNFQFVGEAGGEKIRQEALKLEQFRAAFQRAFPAVNVASPSVPTVLIFKDSESFAPFKPVRENGAADKSISGFFQSSDEESYIAYPLSGTEKSSGTSFHEYIHFLIKNNFQTSVLPVWLNEGLAEYYQTFRMKNDRRAIFGEPQSGHLRLLRETKLVPMKTISAVDYQSLNELDTDQKKLFYAQSWAVVHYLMQKNDGLIDAPIRKYLALTAAGKSPETAFEKSFETTFSALEKEVENYILKKSPASKNFDLGGKLVFETNLETQPIGEAEWLNYLGNLFFQSQRYGEAAEILQKSLALDDRSAKANLAFGKTLAKQGKPTDAKNYFEKAVALDGENYAANYYLADILFRENVSADGFVGQLPKDDAKKIRELLKKVIKQNPNLVEAYKMLASISLANDDEVAESIGYVQNALKIQPQNFRLEYVLAQLYLRKKDFENARKTAAGLIKNCIEKDFCQRVQAFVSALDSIEQKEKELAELRKKYGLENVNFAEENLLPPEEAMNRALNRALRKPLENEKRFVGNLTEIVCGKIVTFKIEGENRILKLTKPSFDGIFLISFSRNTAGMRIECGKPKTEMFVVATYKNDIVKKFDSDGELSVLEFVPKEFKLIE